MSLLVFPPPGPDDPEPFPAITDRNLSYWLDEGRELLEVAAGSLGLGESLRALQFAPDALRQILLWLEKGGKGLLGGLTSLLGAGSVSLGGWFKGFLGSLVPRHVAAAMAGGMRSSMTTLTDWVNRQAGFLNRWRQRLAAGIDLLDGTIIPRAESYASAVWTTGQNFYRFVQSLRGFKNEIRVLGPADHCRGCLAEARKKWQPIGSLLPIGGAECRVLCHCHFEFR